MQQLIHTERDPFDCSLSRWQLDYDANHVNNEGIDGRIERFFVNKLRSFQMLVNVLCSSLNLKSGKSFKFYLKIALKNNVYFNVCLKFL